MLLWLLLFLSAVLYFLNYFIRRKRYWKIRNVLQVDRIISRFMSEGRSLAEIYKEICDQYPEFPYYGTFFGPDPMLLLNNLQDIQSVLESDFYSFNNRGIVTNSREVLTDNMLFINDYNRWKLLKQKMAPIFSNVKLKSIFNQMEEGNRKFIDSINQNKLIEREPFKVLYELVTKVMAEGLFGMNKMSNKMTSHITDMIWHINDTTYKNNLIFSISNSYPMLFKALNLKHFDNYNEIFLDIMKQVIASRQFDSTIRDFIDFGLNLRHSGPINDSDTGYKVEVSDEILASQSFSFFMGGVENGSIAIHFALLELANNKNILQKLHSEIDDVFEKSNNELFFEDLKKLHYLDMILSEVMRKYPPVPAIQRRCTADTALPSTGLKVEKNTIIIIPIYAIHRNERYYPNPDKFDPERFSSNNESKINKLFYMPFGEGRRRCFGLKYARFLIKCNLAWILRKYTLKEQKYEPKKFDPSYFSLKDVNARFVLIPRDLK